MPNLLTRLSEWTNARRKLVWLILFVLIVAVVAIVLTPVFLIMPFKAQTSRTMEISYFMRRWSPLLTLFGSLTILTLMTGLCLADAGGVAPSCCFCSFQHSAQPGWRRREPLCSD